MKKEFDEFRVIKNAIIVYAIFWIGVLSFIGIWHFVSKWW